MPRLMLAACDGGGLNTLAGAGGILEVEIRPRRRARYFEFPDGGGGSVHMVLPTPDKRALIASSANVGQLFVIPRDGDRFDFASFRRIASFNTLGSPSRGTDAQTAMFDFLDDDHVCCQYNRKLVSVHLGTGEMEVLVDIGAQYPEKADILHQISVTPKWVVVDEVVKGGIFVWNRETGELQFMGDGFPGGHHLVTTNSSGETVVIRPSFGFQSRDAYLKVDDNALTFYNLDSGQVQTRYYSWELENHHPTDMHADGNHLFLSFAVPGSVCKIDLESGNVAHRFRARPWIGTRYASMLLDGLVYFTDNGTMRNRHDTGAITVPLFTNSLLMGRTAGTRAGFFAMGFSSELDEIYVCHRGLNRIYCLSKSDLSERWSMALPARGEAAESPLKNFAYNRFDYFKRCLGVHHGTLIET